MVSKREMKIKLKDKLLANTFVEPNVYDALQLQIEQWISLLIDETVAAYNERLDRWGDSPETSRKVTLKDVSDAVFRCEENIRLEDRAWLDVVE